MSSPDHDHSADVRLHLLIGGQTLDLARISPRGCVLGEAAEFPPCEAEVVMHVDGRARHWKVILPEGILKSSREVKYSICGLPRQDPDTKHQ